MRIVYVGPVVPDSTCAQRLRVLHELGNEMLVINTRPDRVLARERRWWYRIAKRWCGPWDEVHANYWLREFVSREQVDVIWLDKALTIQAATLSAVRRVARPPLIVGYSPDDMGRPHNQSRQLLNGLRYYDIFFTTKSFGVAELRALGCPRVEFVSNSYDPLTHRPVAVTAEDRRAFGGAVGFIGTFEKERAQVLLYLAEHGVAVRVWGNNWERFRSTHELLRIERHAVTGHHYAKAISAFDINLNFLRKLNRDLQTQRSVEIPACGAFMLAERSSEHQGLFHEGREAEFFSSAEEVLLKVRYYLANAEARQRIAAAGYRRCLESGYSHECKFTKLLTVLHGMQAARTASAEPVGSGG